MPVSGQVGFVVDKVALGQVVSFLLAFPPISYKHSCSLPFVLHAPPISFLSLYRYMLKILGIFDFQLEKLKAISDSDFH
jgi:hypothetical protein